MISDRIHFIGPWGQSALLQQHRHRGAASRARKTKKIWVFFFIFFACTEAMHCVLSFFLKKQIFMSEHAGLDTFSGVDLQGGEDITVVTRSYKSGCLCNVNRETTVFSLIDIDRICCSKSTKMILLCVLITVKDKCCLELHVQPFGITEQQIFLVLFFHPDAHLDKMKKKKKS